MKLWHIGPKDEVEAELHVADPMCICDPEIVTQDRLDESFLAGDLVYQHNFFSPLGWNQGNETFKTFE
jgi:hypothetical protein